MKVVTAVVNNPRFIELQYFSLKRFMPCEYEFIVFNDAKTFKDFTNGGDLTTKQRIIDMCTKYDIKCIDIPNEHHIYNIYASDRTADSMNFIMNYQKRYPDEYLLLDSDMFLIDTFDIEKYRKYHCAFVLQRRESNKCDKCNRYEEIYYLWNGIFYFNLLKMDLFNFNLLSWNRHVNCDTGGLTSIWYNNHLSRFNETIPSFDEIANNNTSSKTIYYINFKKSETWNENDAPDCVKNNEKLLKYLQQDPRNKDKKFFSEIYDDCIFHYRAGGNWKGGGLDFHNSLSQKLLNVILDR